MTDPADLIAWLRAQLDDERQEILRHGPPIPGPPWMTGRITTIGAGATVVMHPTRMLADLDADRRLIAEYERVDQLIPGSEGAIRNELLSVRRAYRVAIAHRAAARSGLPGYREEWRP